MDNHDKLEKQNTMYMQSNVNLLTRENLKWCSSKQNNFGNKKKIQKSLHNNFTVLTKKISMRRESLQDENIFVNAKMKQNAEKR